MQAARKAIIWEEYCVQVSAVLRPGGRDSPTGYRTVGRSAGRDPGEAGFPLLPLHVDAHVYVIKLFFYYTTAVLEEHLAKREKSNEFAWLYPLSWNEE